MELGQFQVYTGNGKGKTTAALGLALRACGAGLRVYLCQFMKYSESSEIAALNRMTGVTVEHFGSVRGLLLGRSVERSDIDCAAEAYHRVRRALCSGEYDVVIADEINCAMMFGLLSESDLLALADCRPAGTELVFTGRGATEAILERADLVTEMKMIKHYYADRQLPARTGIEL